MSIEGRAPVNRTAARVLGKGESYVSKKRITQTLSETPLPTIPFDGSCGGSDLTGRKFGRFTVIGKYAEKVSQKSMWVVRCLCGRYCLRKSKAIRNPSNNIDCCDECRQLIYLKRSEQHRNGSALKSETKP